MPVRSSNRGQKRPADGKLQGARAESDRFAGVWAVGNAPNTPTATSDEQRRIRHPCDNAARRARTPQSFRSPNPRCLFVTEWPTMARHSTPPLATTWLHHFCKGSLNMAILFSSASRLARARLGLLLVAGLAWNVGCGGGNDQPVTAQTSKFQVASGDEQNEPAAKGDVAVAADDAKATSDDLRAALAKPPSRPPAVVSGEPGAEDGAAPGGRPAAGLRVTPDNIPNGSPEELMALLNEVEEQGPTRARSNRELLDNVQQWLKTRIAIVDKVLDAEGEVDEKLRVKAAQSKRGVLIQMIQAGLPNVEKQMLEFCEAMKKDRSPALVRIGILTDLQLNLAMVMSGAKEETEDFDSALEAALGVEPADDEVFQAVVAAAVTMQQAGKSDSAFTAYQAIQKKFADSKNERVQTILGQIEQLAKMIEVKFDALFKAAIAKEENADVELAAAVDKLLEGKPGAPVFERLSQAALELESNRRYDLAGKFFASLGEAFKDHPDVAKEAAAQLAAGQRRAKLIGQPLVVAGKKVDGKDLDWKEYEGKIVLIDFWATWCEPCRREMPNLKRTLDRFRDQGFEIVGVNIDKERADVDQFFSVQALPWTNIVEGNDLADTCGVEAIPFVVLVGRDGRVIDLHLRGELLGQRLEEIFDAEAKGGDAPAAGEKPAQKPATEKPAAEKPAAEKPAADKPAEPAAEAKPAEAKPAADAKPASEKPAAEKPATEKPAEPQANLFHNRPSFAAAFVGEGFVAVDEQEPPAPKRTPAARRAAPGANVVGKKEEAADAADAKPANDEPEVNPYLARPNLKTAELVDFVFNMQEKPKAIQGRKGFTEAIVDAADRVLAAPDASDKFRGIAASAKIEALHKKASMGDKDADQQLAKFVDTLKEKPIAAVSDLVKFLLLEREVMQANDLPLDKIPALLDQIKQYCGAEKLEGRHLRLASSTVEAINRLEDGDAREKQFAEFGKMFAKSADKELARYGKKLAKAPAGKESDLVGKPLELAGTTASGAPFDWATYRGKVVIVDFWATWCGPCIRELPNVKATHEKYKDRGFDILGISLDQDQEALADFLQKNPLPWQTLAGDGTQELAQKYGVRGIPTVMLVDREGKVLGVAHRIEQLIPELEKQLAGK